MDRISTKPTIASIIFVSIIFVISISFVKEPVVVNYIISFYSFTYFYLFIRLFYKKDKNDIERLVAVCKDEYVFDENPELLKDAKDEISRKKFNSFTILIKIMVMVPYVLPCLFATDIFIFIIYGIQLVIFAFLTCRFIYPKVSEIGKMGKFSDILMEARFKDEEE